MTDQKLNLNINLREIRYLWVPDFTDYKLEFKTDPIWRSELIKINRLDELQYTEAFAVADAKIRDGEIP